MEQWLILSNIVNYIQQDRHSKSFYNLNLIAENKEKYKRKLNSEKEETPKLGLDLGAMSVKLKEEYLDVYKGIQSEILSTARFDKNLDLGTTYSGGVKMTTRWKNYSQYQNKGTQWENY